LSADFMHDPGGHSDLIAGAVMTRTPQQGKAVKTVQNTCGGGIAVPRNSEERMQE
jgi:cystathionine beta-lyase/cystathionine gamma-synthase